MRHERHVDQPRSVPLLQRRAAFSLLFRCRNPLRCLPPLRFEICSQHRIQSCGRTVSVYPPVGGPDAMNAPAKIPKHWFAQEVSISRSRRAMV